MERGLSLLLLICVFKGYSTQGDNDSADLPSERGLILSVKDKNSPIYALIRHVPIYLGYESFNGSIPGFKITSNNSKTHVYSIEVDYRTKDFFMYDYYLGSIIKGTGYHKDLDYLKIGLDSLHVGVSKGTVQIAYDWLSKTVYWTDSTFRWIIAAPGEQSKLSKDYSMIIVDDHLDAPDGITVDPLEGYLFWSDNGRHPKLERSDLDGKNRHTIVTQHLRSPISIKADIFGKRVYWINSRTDEVLSATYEGKDVKLIRRIPSSILYDIAIYKDALYVSDVSNDELYTINKTSGKMMSTILKISNETIYSLAVYGNDTQPLKDKDYCGIKDCAQLCITQKSNAKCVCADGYTSNYNASTGICKESTAQFHKAVVFSNTTHICLLDIRGLSSNAYGLVCRFTVLKPPTPPSTSSTSSPGSTTTPSPPTPKVSSLDMIKMFDLDVDNRIIYFATGGNKIFRRPVDLPIENNAAELIIEARGIISGLAYDLRYSRNLYWSELNTGSIWYMDTATLFSNRLSPGGLQELVQPRNIIVLPHVRKLAWISGIGQDVSIQIMDTTGGNARTLVTNLKEVVSMVYNHETRIFYFISNETIHQVALNGTKLRSIDPNYPPPYLLFSYNNFIGWVYNYSTRHGNVLRTKDLSKNITMSHGILNHKSLFNGIKALDTNLKLPDASPCAHLNGGCEQVCIPKYSNDAMDKVCGCTLGFKLEANGVNCRSDVTKENFLLVTDWTNTALHQIDLQTDAINSLYNEERALYKGVYWDVSTQRLLWTEQSRSMIYSSKLDGSEKRTVGNLGIIKPYRLDKDLTTGNLYYTAFVYQLSSVIGVLTPSGTNRLIGRTGAREYIGDIVVHPEKGLMFYTVTSQKSYIARANMDGTNKKKIIIGNHVTIPGGLAIDFTRNTLYWSDALHDTIQRCNLDGERCFTIVNKTGTYKPEQIRDIVTDGQYLYYSASLNDHIVRLNINAPNAKKLVGQNPSLGNLDTIALYTSSNKNKQPVSQACKARNGLGNCSTICIPTETGRICACDNNVALRIDGRTCANTGCADVISQNVQSSKGKETIDIVIDRQCSRFLNDKCSYTCPAHYTPRKPSEMLLTCTKVGWDRETEPLCEEKVCSASPVLNGKIIGECGRRIGDACLFDCMEGLQKTSHMVLCDNDLNWSPKQPCAEVAVSSSKKQTGDGVPVGGVAGIVVALLAIIIALVIVIFFLLRRRRAARQSAASAEFHKGQDGSIAIENPGYIPSQPSTVDTAEEHPYSTVEPGQIHLGETEADKLPEVSHVTHDTAVLTVDSWMKERQKN